MPSVLERYLRIIIDDSFGWPMFGVVAASRRVS